MDSNKDREGPNLGFLTLIRHKSSNRYICDLSLNKLHEDILDVEKFISTELIIEVFID